ncbi:unnamed protein product [Owenia fusiformis]|uniref:Uncharacterized protein n=1 Tax=Owenia fusiformis TaxID=6347 RepID=A0A8J1U4Q4_OWEFU|nr:unnamed protein product [Owenia fusiformis]
MAASPASYNRLQEKCNEGTRGVPCIGTVYLNALPPDTDVNALAKEQCRLFLDGKSIQNCQQTWNLILDKAAPLDQEAVFKSLTQPEDFQVELVIGQLKENYFWEDEQLLKDNFLSANIDHFQLYQAGDGEQIQGVALMATLKSKDAIGLFYFVD